MDILNDILDTLNFRSAVYFVTDFTPPWGVSVPEHPQAARFHLVLQGSCHVRFASGTKLELHPGDLVLIPRGRSHVLTDSPDREAAQLETLLARTGYNGEGSFIIGEGDTGTSTRMICGHFAFRQGADHPLLRALPEYLVSSTALRTGQPWLEEILRLISTGVTTGEMGSTSAVTRLSEVVFIELLRFGVGQCESLKSVLEAFRDQQIGKALELIHARPEHPWTVEGLAAEVYMSRSRFAERFSELVGLGPMAYLTEWRLQKSLPLLETSHCSVKQIAGLAGYRSPAAFTRAFSGKFGLSPRQYRQQYQPKFA